MKERVKVESLNFLAGRELSPREQGGKSGAKEHTACDFLSTHTAVKGCTALRTFRECMPAFRLIARQCLFVWPREFWPRASEPAKPECVRKQPLARRRLDLLHPCFHCHLRSLLSAGAERPLLARPAVASSFFFSIFSGSISGPRSVLQMGGRSFFKERDASR